MSEGGARTVWVLLTVLAITNAALFGAVKYLRLYNPAHWVSVSDDFRKVLLADQYPDRLESSAVGFAEVTRVELVGTPGMLDPRRAEVWVDTMTGRRVKVYYGNLDVYQYAEDLSKHLDRPLVVTNYQRELKAREKPLEAGGAEAPVAPAGAAGAAPELPSTR